MRAATEAIGMMASLTSFLLWLPQGARVWRTRHDLSQLQGIALSTQVISLLGNVLWGVYALAIGSFWLGAPSVVNGPIALATIVIVRRAQRAADREATPAPVPDAAPRHARSACPRRTASGRPAPARQARRQAQGRGGAPAARCSGSGYPVSRDRRSLGRGARTTS
ncbi:hypothetical protein [Cellulomonas fimi]|uniref:MtN3 and saliva related transmembrane protein n=1 Tax=Cellulomonas fimi TaxID=1708 RepID=A0A7Y0M2M0_CELFI|nr:hypothetical protein [Cellulomonas fimi]NMR21352.1 hypothetical protein [Cellulomonas fimi]